MPIHVIALDSQEPMFKTCKIEEASDISLQVLQPQKQGNLKG